MRVATIEGYGTQNLLQFVTVSISANYSITVTNILEIDPAPFDLGLIKLHNYWATLDLGLFLLSGNVIVLKVWVLHPLQLSS